VSDRLAGVLWRWRYLLSGLIVLVAIASIPHANITRIDNDISAWFSQDDPVYRDYERFRDEFGGSRTLIIALKSEAPDAIFSQPSLDFIRDVTAAIERVDTVERVASLSTATTVEGRRSPPAAGAAGESVLDVRRLVDPNDPKPAAEVRRRALDDELIRGDLVSEDATVTAIVVSFDERRIDRVRGGVIQSIHDIVDPKLPPGIRAYYNGSLEISETYNRITLQNQRTFTPPIFVVTLLAVYLSFKSWRKMVLTIVAVGISVLWTLGLYWLLGYSFNVLASMLVPLIVVLAIADDVHIMQHWDEVRRHLSAEAAFKETVAHLATPLLGASGTTALGMASLATSSVVAVRAFGIGSAVGIMVDFMISLVFVPTMLSLLKPETAETPHERYLVQPMRRIAMFSTRRPRQVLCVTIGLSCVAGFGIVRLRVDTNHINFFSPSHPLGQSARIIDSELSGIYSFQIMLEGPPESLGTPANLQRMQRLEQDLLALDGVKKTRSAADYVRRVNKELHDGDPAAAIVPSDPATVAQELFVFTIGGEGRHELERVLATDYSRAQIDVKLRSMSSDVVLTLINRADARAREIFAGSGVTATTTGAGRLFSTLDHYLVSSQINSFGTAFFTVFGVIFVIFRSARFGFLTIAPNVLPVLAVLGIMGFMGISMNIATVMVASVALGVVDDDTIHFINRYRREVSAGATTDAAIETATVHEGRASLTTAVINSLGFGVLLFSEYKPTAWFGGLLGLTMAVAFLAEVFILPATIKVLPGMFGADALRRGRRKLATPARRSLGEGGA
jgi:predicted RND superfamily exporter protein